MMGGINGCMDKWTDGQTFQSHVPIDYLEEASASDRCNRQTNWMTNLQDVQMTSCSMQMLANRRDITLAWNRIGHGDYSKD